MAATTGNQFWKQRCKHGKDKIFSSPEMLWECACEYFQWVDENPLIEMKPFAFQGESWSEPIPKMRAMTINGLCLYLGIGESTLWDYGNKEQYKDYSQVVELIKKTIYEQKFTGAAADLLNANIIARDLGLRDKSDVDHSSKDGSMSPAFDKDKYKSAQADLSDKLK